MSRRLPGSGLVERVRARRRAGLPALGGRARLERLAPVDRYFGYPRGRPIDRFYIEGFLARHGAQPGYLTGDIRGRVLEIGGSEYARAFSAEGGIEKLDVLHADDSNPEATIVADLQSGEGVPDTAFDCVICTQTLHLLFDIGAAVATLHRALRPGGVALVTAPGLTPSCGREAAGWGDYWRLTPGSARKLFEREFPAEGVAVETYGNLRTATAFLHGLATEDLTEAELAVHDPDFPVTIAVRAVKGRSDTGAGAGGS
jgi:SAM-dependent methyltransferase